MRTPRILVWSLAALAAVTFASGCSASNDPEFTARAITPAEQEGIEEQATLAGREHAYSSIIKALVSKKDNHAVQMIVAKDRNSTTYGKVMFANCPTGRTLQQCADQAPTVDNFRTYMGVSYAPDQKPNLNGEPNYQAQVGNVMMTCRATGAFQLNPYTMGQIPRVFKAFKPAGGNGDMPVDFGSQEHDTYPAQGKVMWHCDSEPVAPASAGK